MKFRNRLVSGVVAGLVVAVVFLLSACETMHSFSIPSVEKTPAAFGDIPIYYSDIVPFEYEEIGIVLVWGNNQENAIKEMASKAKSVGADAIINFRATYGVGGLYIVVAWGGGGGTGTDINQRILQGLAVRKMSK